MYIVHGDAQGERFAEALARKAREGVRVRVLYDWLGGFGKTWPFFWRSLRAAGAEVRVYNRPRLDQPLGWLYRDHRKLDRRGRHRRLRDRVVHRQGVGGRSGPWCRAVARHRPRDTRTRGRGSGGRLRRLVGGRRRAAAGRRAHERRAVSRWRCRAACRRRHAQHGRPPARGSARRGDGAEDAVAHRRVLRGDDVLRAGAAGGRGRRRGRAAPRAGGVRHSRAGADLSRRLSAAARGRHPRVRVERVHAAREDGGRRRPLGARRIDEPEHRELDRQSRARRRRRGRGVCRADGIDVRRGPRARDRNRAGPAPSRSGTISRHAGVNPGRRSRTS